MNANEIKKTLYKEKPIAKLSFTYKSGDKLFLAETSSGQVEFYVPLKEQKNADGSMVSLFEEQEIPAQLLIRWIKL